MHPHRLYCFIFLLMIAANLPAQDIDVEKLFDGEIEIEEQSVMLEYLEQLQQSPLNVNNASVKELSILPWLSPIIAVRIVQYRHEYGDFRKLEDIQNVRGVKSIYDKISPFLTTGKTNIAVSAQGRHRMSSRFEDSKAYQEHIYAGTKEKSLNRFKASITDHIQLGLLFEKDAGEKHWNDLSLGNIAVNLPAISTTVVGGHFSAEFGQGLVYAGPYRMLKGGDPIAPAKQRRRGL